MPCGLRSISQFCLTVLHQQQHISPPSVVMEVNTKMPLHNTANYSRNTCTWHDKEKKNCTIYLHIWATTCLYAIYTVSQKYKIYSMAKQGLKPWHSKYISSKRVKLSNSRNKNLASVLLGLLRRLYKCDRWQGKWQLSHLQVKLTRSPFCTHRLNQILQT